MNKKLRNIIMTLTLSSTLFVPSFADDTLLSTAIPVEIVNSIVEEIADIVDVDSLKVRNIKMLDYKIQFKEGSITKDEYKSLTAKYFEEYNTVSNKIYDKKTNRLKDKLVKSTSINAIGETKTKEQYVEYYNNIIEKHKKKYENGKVSEAKYKTVADRINKKIEYIKSQN